MATLSQIHDGRPVVEDQVFGWRSLEKAWQNFAVLVQVIAKEHADDGSHAGLAQAIADLAAHIADTDNPHAVTATQAGAAPASHLGAGGTAHAEVSPLAAGFATPDMLAKAEDQEARIGALEGRPWGGSFVWTGTHWQCSVPVGVSAVGSQLSTGVCEISLSASMPSVHHYRVAITQHVGSDPAVFQVEKLTDVVLVHMFDTREEQPIDVAGFDIAIHPIG